MLLIGSGQTFVRDLETAGALAIYVAPVGGSEGHYRRRLRGAGYGVVHMSAKGIGDLSAYLTGTHGVRPPHLGKSDRRTYFFPALVDQYRQALSSKAKGLVFWFYEGHVLAQQELNYLIQLSAQDPHLKFVVEVARDRVVRWQPLNQALSA